MTSCHSAKQTESQDSEIHSSAIFFVVLKISKDTVQGRNMVELVSKTKSAGQIKEENQSHVEAERFLTIDLYERNELVNTLVLAHPLYKNIEYFDGVKLATKYVELDKEEFFIRFQMNDGNANKIKISETLIGANPKELATIKL